MKANGLLNVPVNHKVVFYNSSKISWMPIACTLNKENRILSNCKKTSFKDVCCGMSSHWYYWTLIIAGPCDVLSLCRYIAWQDRANNVVIAHPQIHRRTQNRGNRPRWSTQPREWIKEIIYIYILLAPTKVEFDAKKFNGTQWLKLIKFIKVTINGIIRNIIQIQEVQRYQGLDDIKKDHESKVKYTNGIRA